MPTQQTVLYSKISDDVLSLNNAHTIAVINLYGELVYQNTRGSTAISGDKIQEQFRKLSFSTSILAFENIKFMLTELDDMKAVVFNTNENSIIIGMNEKAVWNDISAVLNYFSVLQPF